MPEIKNTRKGGNKHIVFCAVKNICNMKNSVLLS
jgi:hypothetical protein